MVETSYTVDMLFAGKDALVRAIYDRLREALQGLGPFSVEPKKTSIHLVNKVGFAGVHPRKGYMYLNLRTEHAIANARVVKTEQVSKNRYHNEVKLDSPDAVDAELREWLSEAYSLGG
ncbi:MAG: DUF5655 domain-containing protein [Chloroflexota bacterium]|nr:DUF5655 domain-containing protein [Chloroflexota bacterium]